MKRWQKYRMKFILLVMFIFPLAVYAKSYGEERNLYLLSDGISAMEIECGAGFLKLKGIEGVDEIKVKADIIAGNKKGSSLNEFIEENIDLTLEKHGNRAVLISRFKPSFFSFSFRGNGDNRIDLTVEVPRKMNLEIKDGSGDIELNNINGTVDLDDGSGSIDIADVEGEVVIHDGSGELNIHNVKGDMKIHDGSGSIEIIEATGDMTIHDGSGEIKVEKVSGDINITDGSGSLWTADIDGSVTISDGSGSIYIDGVSRDVDIVESGSGGVRFNNIKGNISGDL